MTQPFTRTDDPGPGPTEAQKRQQKQDDYVAGRLHPSFEVPERCPSCGATLKNVGFQGVLCPHCGDDLEDLAKRGVVWTD